MKTAKNKKQKGLVLPRGYISWSQLDLWEKNREEYKQVYFYGKERPTNDAMKFGTHIGRMIDGKEKPNDHIEQSVKLLCKKYDKQEEHIRIEMETNYGKVTLDGYIDTFDTKNFDFAENKTGTTKWTEKKAEKHGQLHFYALLIFLKTGIRKNRTILQHFETELDQHAPYGRKLTGHINHYEVDLFIGHELEIRRRIENAAREISVAYQEALTV